MILLQVTYNLQILIPKIKNPKSKFTQISKIRIFSITSTRTLNCVYRVLLLHRVK